jgi:hypothetical protein
MRHKLEVSISPKNQDNNPGKTKRHQMPDLGLGQSPEATLLASFRPASGGIRRGEHPAFN